MDSTRQQKIARLIQKELSELFLMQTKSHISSILRREAIPSDSRQLLVILVR